MKALEHVHHLLSPALRDLFINYSMFCEDISDFILFPFKDTNWPAVFLLQLQKIYALDVKILTVTCCDWVTIGWLGCMVRLVGVGCMVGKTLVAIGG